MNMKQSRSRAAFTLVELLVVIFILVLLAGMMMPMLNIIRNEALKSRTTFTLSKVDASLRLFKTDWGVYPYQGAYPDLAATNQAPTTASNHLAYRLGTTIADADRLALNANIAAAQSAFAYNCVGLTEGPQPAPAINYTVSDVMQANDNEGTPAAWAQFRTCVALLLNRMASERAGTAILAGDIAMKGPIISDPAGAMKVNRSAMQVLTTPQTGTPGIDPGMANDYLLGDIDHRSIAGDAILDAWKRPLVYVCQVVPGVRNTPIWVCGSGYPFYTKDQVEGCFDPRNYGLGAAGFDPATGPVGSITAANRSVLLFGGRIPLSRTDAGDGQATPADVAFFPDATQLLGSDMRYYAAPGYETEFELWSAGRDGGISYRRDDAVNADNIAVQNYNRPVANE